MTLRIELLGEYPNYREWCEGTQAEINAHTPNVEVSEGFSTDGFGQGTWVKADGTWRWSGNATNPTISGTVTLSGTGGGTPTPLTNLGYQTFGTVNGYFQNNIQNLSNNTSASSDWVATANNGTDNAHYVDFGINGSAYSNGTWTINGADDGYLYAQSDNLAVGTATAGKSLVLFTGGTLAANVRLTLADALATFSGPVTVSSGALTVSSGNIAASAGSVTAGTTVSGNSLIQTVQAVAVSTTPSANIASGNTVIIGAGGVPGPLTAATNITFSNPQIGSTTFLVFQQGTTSYAVTFTIAGYTFYQNGKTAGVASGSVVLAAADMTLSQFCAVEITWLSATTASVKLVKS
jgi:hypothetical protein